ncbi:MAG: hypothetical protein ABJL54_10520 [Halioglobus sp.]
MSISKTMYATCVLAVSMSLSTSIQAEIIQNTWDPIDEYIENDVGCGDATGFMLEGMAHVKVSNLKKGGFAVNVNAKGSFTAIDGVYEGQGAIFRQNINDVWPLYDELTGNDVYTYRESVRVIGKGQAGDYKLDINYHFVQRDGQVKSIVDDVKMSCK